MKLQINNVIDFIYNIAEIMNSMVTDFTKNTITTDEKVRQDLNQQTDQIQARIMKR